jgi:hypothetical protein
MYEKFINTAAVSIPDQMAGHTIVEIIYFIFKGSLFQHLFESPRRDKEISSCWTMKAGLGWNNRNGDMR